MSNEILSRITASLVNGEPDLAVAAVVEALAAGLEPMAIIHSGLVPGMRLVGEKFSCGEYFLPHLMVAANGMKQAMQRLDPELKARRQSLSSQGKVIIGTVQGDIHEIGKSLVATMLAAHGFEVCDLGVDVPIGTIVDAVRVTGANLVGLSSLLTTTMIMQQKTIEALITAGLRKQVKVMVGGAPVNRRWAEDIGADGYAEDAVDAVALARRLVCGC
jgi:corrinoid protein of di/trimethylamine methyltransferase